MLSFRDTRLRVDPESTNDRRGSTLRVAPE